jgi:phosphoribosylglycinamide formyltransferase-1
VSGAAALPRVAILVSGAGSNMLAIARHCRAGDIPASIVLVASDRPTAAALPAAAALGLETLALAPDPAQSRAEFDARLRGEIEVRGADLVVLAGFMRILSPEFVGAFAGRMLNIHPSLLPRHKGLHTHRHVLEAGDTEHGATVHYVTPELDGGPAILQARIRVRPDDDTSSLAARVQHCEHLIYPRVVDWIARGRLRCPAGVPELDGNPLVSPLVEDFA